MISENNLGRYEYVGGGSDKYWHVIFDKTKREYVAQWGKRTASQPQGTKVYSESEVRKKINEKVKKGYRQVQGYNTSTGSNSIHFILEDEAA
jgi:predicted DNA-binding WGR domain protein